MTTMSGQVQVTAEELFSLLTQADLTGPLSYVEVGQVVAGRVFETLPRSTREQQMRQAVSTSYLDHAVQALMADGRLLRLPYAELRGGGWPSGGMRENGKYYVLASAHVAKAIERDKAARNRQRDRLRADAEWEVLQRENVKAQVEDVYRKACRGLGVDPDAE